MEPITIKGNPLEDATFVAGGSVSFSAAGGRTVLVLKPDGTTIFDDDDVDKIVETFWESIGTSFPVLGPYVQISAGTASDGTGGATVKIHRNGDVTGEHYSPDERTLRLWNKVAAAWPQEQ